MVFHPEYIIDDNENKKAVIIPYNEWQKLLSNLEELEDIKAFDAAKLDLNDKEIPFEEAIKLLKNNKLK